MDVCVSFIAVALSTLVTIEVVGGKKTFEYTVNNQLVQDYFSNSITLDIKSGEDLLYYIALAVETNSTAFSRFEITYSPSPDKFEITSINFVDNDDNNFWQLRNSSGPLGVGISDYFPDKDDEIMFNFTARE